MQQGLPLPGCAHAQVWEAGMTQPVTSEGRPCPPLPLVPAKHGPPQKLKHAEGRLQVAKGHGIQAQLPGQVLQTQEGREGRVRGSGVRSGWGVGEVALNWRGGRPALWL